MKEVLFGCNAGQLTLQMQVWQPGDVDDSGDLIQIENVQMVECGDCAGKNSNHKGIKRHY